MEITKVDGPVAHVIIDNWIDVSTSDAKEIQRADSKILWAKYDNDCEKKKASNGLGSLPHCVTYKISHLISKSSVLFFNQESGINAEILLPDGLFHGGGLHVYEPGGFLAPHIDYALHPHLPGMERRLNAILFLNDWKEEWGGALTFYDDMATNVVARVYPKRGRLVLWEPTDTAFHGCEMVTGPESRHTIAVYYLAPARPGVTRKRALFCPQRDKK